MTVSSRCIVKLTSRVALTLSLSPCLCSYQCLPLLSVSMSLYLSIVPPPPCLCSCAYALIYVCSSYLCLRSCACVPVSTLLSMSVLPICVSASIINYCSYLCPCSYLCLWSLSVSLSLSACMFLSVSMGSVWVSDSNLRQWFLPLSMILCVSIVATCSYCSYCCLSL